MTVRIAKPQVATETKMTSILHLEDNLLDHKLVAAQLAEAGLELRLTRVDTESGFRKALREGCVDLILADYRLPQFDGLAALRLAQEMCPNVPVIIVSGAMGEMVAVDVLKAGATDYILKNHLERVVPAVRRALREAEDRQARQHAEQAIREARDQAEAANRAKDQFLAILSHELRTPLTPTLTTIQMMEADPNLPGEFHDAVRMIRRNVELEVRLIDDLLNLTRISQGKLQLNLRPTDAHDTIRQVLAICDSDLHGKRLTVAVELTATQPRVMADPARLHQILWNIVKNAVKFTAPGGHITVHTFNVNADALKIQVSDTGIGIEPEALPKIFDAFEQGGKQITRQFGGLGLGLAISRALAEQHGGSLTASSAGKDQGATFSLRLPVTHEMKMDASPANNSVKDQAALQGCHVLLVEDHPDTARAMTRLIKRWGCVVETADSVATAMEAANAMPFDVLITDIGLPDGSGLDLMRQLRARRPIKGIAISGFGMEEDLRKSEQAGFAEHLVKPVDLRLLETTLARVLGRE
jgi:signal transduction histidine kinase